MASMEAALIHGVAKASWMQRQSSVLGRWKYTFCVLYRDGKFAYYNDENRKDELESVMIPKSCYAVNAGVEVVGVTPPSDRKIDCLLGLRTHTVNMTFCADSVDDCVSWKSSILEVKNALTPQARRPAVAPPPFVAPPVVMAPPPYTQVAPPVQQVVISPALGSTTYTTYRTPNTYVAQPTNQTVIVSGRTTCVATSRRAYPVQNTVYTYPGQTIAYTYQQPAVTRYYY